MGKFYTHDLLGCEDPRIGLLNIGAEETKGTELQKQTFALLKEAHEAGRLNFVGNVEARDVFSGNVDVLVCDGFSGNVLLKCIEGTAMMLMKRLKGIFYKNTANKLAAAVLKRMCMRSSRSLIRARSAARRCSAFPSPSLRRTALRMLALSAAPSGRQSHSSILT